MHITFINPSIFGGRETDAMEPLAFAILAGLTPEEFDLDFYDERLEPLPFDRPTDLVAISISTFTARRAYQIATAYRRRGVPVVAGGYHVTLLPDEAVQYVDAIVIGDAEPVWAQVVADAAAGRLRKRYTGPKLTSLDGVNFDRTIFQGKRYASILPVQFSRGCRYACSYCSIHAFYGNSVLHRPVQEVIEEIRRHRRQYILFVDDNIFVNLETAKALFSALIPLDIRWGCQISIDAAWDEELLDLMERSGCIVALIGFETLERENLRQMAKDWNLKRGSYREAIDNFYRRGIMVFGSFIFGYDHDVMDSFRSTVAFAIEANLFLAHFNLLQPMPGTHLYTRLQQENRLIYEPWWLDPTYHWGDVTYLPAQMTANEMSAGSTAARLQFNSHRSLLRRLQGPINRRSWQHLFLYLGANRINRRELRTKLGKKLGTAETLERFEAFDRDKGSSG